MAILPCLDQGQDDIAHLRALKTYFAMELLGLFLLVITYLTWRRVDTSQQPFKLFLVSLSLTLPLHLLILHILVAHTKLVMISLLVAFAWDASLPKRFSEFIHNLVSKVDTPLRCCVKLATLIMQLANMIEYPQWAQKHFIPPIEATFELLAFPCAWVTSQKGFASELEDKLVHASARIRQRKAKFLAAALLSAFALTTILFIYSLWRFEWMLIASWLGLYAIISEVYEISFPQYIEVCGILAVAGPILLADLLLETPPPIEVNTRRESRVHLASLPATWPSMLDTDVFPALVEEMTQGMSPDAADECRQALRRLHSLRHH
eukprot:Blabericola_migrator_1__1207@NODE_1309_length_4841_cov_86_500628_g881_i0_p2_GENE_NODE_1309_length_4841_cov_86_500628_g881_i0NODE_1309_length_4841_cov_86_500628_g881_i0_p2_ORF_typecomplete_len321_score30_02_NODE_1309_length_4841_cov_86_500628_g881_i029813943